MLIVRTSRPLSTMNLLGNPEYKNSYLQLNKTYSCQKEISLDCRCKLAHYTSNKPQQTFNYQRDVTHIAISPNCNNHYFP